MSPLATTVLVAIVVLFGLTALFAIIFYWLVTRRDGVVVLADDYDDDLEDDDSLEDGFEDDDPPELEERVEELESVLRSWAPVVLAASRVRPDDPGSVRALSDAVSAAGPKALRESVRKALQG